MLLSDTRHASACGTTLIVSLGLLSTPVEAATIVASVPILFASHWTSLRAVEDLLGEDLG